MKQQLPEPQVETIALFPKNHRFITEHSFSVNQSHTIKVVLVSVVSLFLLTLIFLQSVTLWYNIRQQEALSQDRTQLQNEVTYWEQIASKYQGYRDVYYRIAALQYKLGDTGESQKYIRKALQLDPNYPEGRVLGAMTGLKN
jgi:tetratricopeptide (TPR) repeat protein